MQFEITYTERQPQWKGKPGTLFRPVPRTPEELAEAVKTLVANGNLERITITPVNENEPKAK